MNTSALLFLMTIAIGADGDAAPVDSQFEAVLASRTAKLEEERKAAADQARKEEERRQREQDEKKAAVQKEALQQFLRQQRAFGKAGQGVRQKPAPFELLSLIDPFSDLHRRQSFGSSSSPHLGQSNSSKSAAGVPAEGKSIATGPWLPQEMQESIRAAWPDGVPIGDNLKFYDIPQYVQQVSYDTGPRWRLVPLAQAGEQHPWIVSGGMHHVPRDQWESVKGLDLPPGERILVWDELVNVNAPTLLPRKRWRFPVGTKAYDVLFRLKNENGKTEAHIFEVRVQEREKDGWDHGTVYRPPADLEHGERSKWTWSFPAAPDIAAKATAYVARIDPDGAWEPNRKLAVDGDFTPTHYLGAGALCNSCHAFAGATGYGSSRRGSDGRFSWHPFGSGGSLDGRWPLRFLARRPN